ncbi:MAG TPA: NAD(P)-dependent oxidoreductase [Bacillota bacterium]|nr:NAD(P)-dependent oxidoreductase [Bacillota bacterium]
MKILLTGPTGFIGSAFTRLARSRGHQVAGLIIPAESIPSRVPPGPDLVWLRGTLETAPWNDIAAFAPDVCVHLAWITTPGVYLESPENERFRDASLQFLRRLRELGTRHCVGIGTCVEYQITNQPLVEDQTPVVPTTTYARCKNDLRLALEADARTYGHAFCWARVFYPYGPGEHPSRLCSSLIQKLSRGEKLVLKTPHSTKDYIYIEDLAAALLTVVEQKARGTINLGTGVGVSVWEIAQALGTLLGKTDLVEAANPPAPDPFPFVVADATRLKALGWRQAVTIQEGLKRMVTTRCG